MDIVDRLIARAQGASALRAGSFSDLAADARDEQWIDQCVNDLSTQEARFATDLLLRALRTTDFIVTEIESEEPLLVFFAGTSRDILIYETLHFSLHALSDALRRTIQLDKTSAGMLPLDIACLTASILGPQHIGEFDSSLHRLDRAQRYLKHVGKLREMTECLIDILISARGATVIGLSETSSDQDAEIEIEVSLRGVVHAAVDNSIGENAEKLSKRYTETLDRTLFEIGLRPPF
jgi:hypothetical protein